MKALADEYFAAFVQTFPLAATFMGVPDAPAAVLGDNSLGAVRAWEAREDAWLARLQQVDESTLSGADISTYGVLKETLEASKQARVCRAELWPLNQQSGLQSFLSFLSQVQPVGDDRKRTDALARWREMDTFIDTEITTLREGLQRGYTQPRPNVEAVIAQLDDLMKLPPQDSPFAALGTRDNAPGFREAVEKIVAAEVIPALGRYRTFLATEYLPKARASTASRTCRTARRATAPACGRTRRSTWTRAPCTSSGWTRWRRCGVRVRRSRPRRSARPTSTPPSRRCGTIRP